MSKVTVNSIVLGQSGTAANNFLIDTDAAGALRIRRNADGSGATVLSITEANTATHAAQSMVRLNTANGFGSTNTKIRRFTNTVTNQGSDITYADSATLGASFTINTSGVYAISFTDSYSGGFDWTGVSLNSSQLTTAINSINASDILCMSSTVSANTSGYSGATVYLPAGSVVRPHAGGGASSGNGAVAVFTITRVS